MKRFKLLAAAAGILSTAIVLFSCSKSGSSPNPNPGGGTGSDTVLVNLGTNIIVPSYQVLASSTAALDVAVTGFNASPSGATLATVQSALKSAYKAWAACSEFEFGPAADASLTTHFTNSFPTDTLLIRSNAGGASYAIDGIGNYAAQGFPALDYLLFANGNDITLARFTTDSHAAGAKTYLAALSASLKAKAATVNTAWSASGGNYLAKFEKATGVDAGSALSLLANAYVQDFDVNLQNYKVGIPIGLYGPSVLPKAPTKVEGYYGALSVQLLVAQVLAIQNIYLGGSGGSLDDKVAASKAQYNGGSLNDAIKAQIATLLTKIQALPDPLSTGIQNNSSAITDAYTEVRKLTVLLKVDMPSALGIKISFQDDDGD
ncbi:MAG TPA: imelysin family protein [Puia sp.]|nr:imelysin family protein [Puia sp.]